MARKLSRGRKTDLGVSLSMKKDHHEKLKSYNAYYLITLLIKYYTLLLIRHHLERKTATAKWSVIYVALNIFYEGFVVFKAIFKFYAANHLLK